MVRQSAAPALLNICSVSCWTAKKKPTDQGATYMVRASAVNALRESGSM
jgi:hypothetical protein